MLQDTPLGTVSKKHGNFDELRILFQSFLERFLKNPKIFSENDLNPLKSLLEKFPFSPEESRQKITPASLALPDLGTSGYLGNHLIGRSLSMQGVYDLMIRAARSDLPVLIQGESGTGKELIAKAIHQNSNRSRKRFFTENCAALPEALLETELFGFTKGSFTGAFRDKAGILELAHGGTLFLDEIGDMSMRMQTKLLRTLQEGEIRRVGGEEILSIDVRIISATNKILEDCVRKGTFREDLFYRINVCCLEIPPLRRRKEDISLLAKHFLEEILRRNVQCPRMISPEAMEILEKFHWPGNVRELQNVIERTVIMCDGEIIDKDTLLMATTHLGADNGSKFSHLSEKPGEQILLEEALVLSFGDKTQAARRIGWSRPKVYRKMKSYRIPRNFGKSLD